MRFTNHTGTNGLNGAREKFFRKPKISRSLRHSIDRANDFEHKKRLQIENIDDAILRRSGQYGADKPYVPGHPYLGKKVAKIGFHQQGVFKNTKVLIPLLGNPFTPNDKAAQLNTTNNQMGKLDNFTP